VGEQLQLRRRDRDTGELWISQQAGARVILFSSFKSTMSARQPAGSF
jgi:hypothetical protein